MNILYLIDLIEQRGGSERHLFDLAEGMLKSGHSVIVATLQGGDYLDDFKALPGINVIDLEVKRIYDLTGFRGILEIKKLLERYEIDIIQTFHAGSDIIGPIAGKLSINKPIILSSRRDMGYTKSLKIKLLQRYVNFIVDHILANSQEVKQAVMDQEKVTSSKISVIYNGIDFNHHMNRRFYDDILSNYRKEGDILIGSLGNIRPVKGYDDLIEAVSLLKKDYPQMVFVVAGHGVTQAMLDRIKYLGLSDNIFFIGGIASDQIYTFLKTLDIYIQPSRSEGFSNSILEAMVAGLPVVVTDTGGNKEIVDHEHDGIKVRPYSPESISRGLSFIVDNPQLATGYAQKAKEKVLRQFRFETMLDKYINFYGEQIEFKKNS